MASEAEIILITGANTGLGFQTVKALCASEKAYTIIVGGRSLDKVHAAIESALEAQPSTRSELRPIQIDIADDESIKKAFSSVERDFGRVDVLINNAGTQLDPQLQSGKMTMRQMWTETWNVNVAGTHITTHTFIPLLLKSRNPRLLFITSGTSTLENANNLALPVNQSPAEGWPKQSLFGVPAYRSSKTGMNMMMLEWARILRADGVKMWCVSPGYLATGLGIGADANKNMGAGDPAEGANFIRAVVEGARDADVGRVVLSNGVQPW